MIAAYVAYHVHGVYPIVGWDYKYFFSRLVDTHLHYRVNGLTIQWYTPSFGGGLPAYPHPLNAQFSLPQLLALVMDAWAAVLLAYAIYTLVGYAGAYIFFRHSLGLGWMPACLGAVIFSANGFYLQHLANGHMNFQAFPILPLFLVALFDRRLSIAHAVALFSLSAGILVYSASIYPTAFIILSLLIVLPLAWLINPSMFDWARFRKVVLWGGILSLALVISKVYAVGSFMRFFPRNMPSSFDIPLFLAPFGLFLQLFGAMGLAPYFALTGQDMAMVRSVMQAYTGAPIGLWELDLSLTPVAWILLLGGIARLPFSLWRAVPNLRSQWKYFLALALLGFAVWLALEFTFARGFFYPTIRELPFLRAMHVNPRFGSAFIFPLALFAAYTLHVWLRSCSERFRLAVFLPLNLLAIAGLAAYFLLPLERLQQRTFFIGGLQDVYQKIERGETFPISHVTDINDQRVFDDRASNIRPYEVLFGYTLGTFSPDIREGLARDVREGAFNMTNPAGLVYPEVNGLQPWERISTQQAGQLEDFLARRQPDWQIPVAQESANLVSLLAFLLLIALFLPIGRWTQWINKK